MSKRLSFSSCKELINRAMGGVNVCMLWVWFCSYHVSISSCHQSLSQGKCGKSSLLCRFHCQVLHWTCRHGVLDCLHSFKQLANQAGYIIVIARVATDLRQSKQTLSLGFALRLGTFTAINPWPFAITITKWVTWSRKSLHTITFFSMMAPNLTLKPS